MDSIFIAQLFSNPDRFFMQLLVVIFSVCLHEYAHAQVALWQGDDTAARTGHLTLNPLKQMGAFSLFILAFIGICWGSVPVDPSRFKHRYSDALVSFAGPFVNLSLFLVFTVLFTLASLRGFGEGALLFFQLGALLNFVLFVLNMLPIPGFDGWNVFAYYLPGLMGKMGNSEFGKGLMLFTIVAVFVLINYIFMAGLIVLRIIYNLLIGVLG